MPPVDPRERNRDARTVILSGGVSEQPPTVRAPAQVEDAENADFLVLDGLTRRAGSWIQQFVQPGFLPAGNNLVHPIIRDATERYVVCHNRTAVAAIVRVLELASNIWATVIPTATAQIYLNAGNPEHLRLRSLLDYTLILNTDVALSYTKTTGTIAGLQGTITANTVANPTVVTSVAHGLLTGDQIFIDHSNSGQKIDGLQTVTKIDADTFNVPVVVAGFAGTQGHWIAASIKVGNPTTIRSVAHGLTTGQTIIITGSNSDPLIDGAQVVTVLTADTFTIPVNVTFPGTVGAWSRASIDVNHMPMAMTRQNTGGATGTMNVAAGATPVCTTPTAHGLVSGQTIIVTASTTVPSINGEYVVTVTGAFTFTIPALSPVINPGTATWTSRAYFIIDVVAWSSRASGDDTTNPVPTLWLNGLKLADLRYKDGRLVLFGGSRITTSQEGDLFNFWIEDVNAVADSDPIDRSLSSDRVTDIESAVPIQSAFLLLTKAGRQFIVSWGTVLTSTTIQARPVTGYTTLSAEPVVMDPNAYYCAQSGQAVQLLEYKYDEIAAPSAAEDASGHAPTFMPLAVDVPGDIGDYEADPSIVRRLLVNVEQGVVFILRRDRVVGGENFSRYLYSYRTRYLGQQKIQGAWTRWKVAGVRGVHDVCTIGNYIYALVHNGPSYTGDFPFYVARLEVPQETEADIIPTPTL